MWLLRWLGITITVYERPKLRKRNLGNVVKVGWQ